MLHSYHPQSTGVLIQIELHTKTLTVLWWLQPVFLFLIPGVKCDEVWSVWLVGMLCLGKNLTTDDIVWMWRSWSFYCLALEYEGAGGHPHSPLSRLGDWCVVCSEYAVMLYIVIQPSLSYRSPDKMGQVIVSRSETCISQHRAQSPVSAG